MRSFYVRIFLIVLSKCLELNKNRKNDWSGSAARMIHFDLQLAAVGLLFVFKRLQWVSIGDRYAHVPKEQLKKAFAWLESQRRETGV